MKIPKLPNGELDWVTLYEKSIFRTVRADIETEALERFVIDAMCPTVSCMEEPTPFATVTTDEEAATHAAELIILVIGAIRKGEPMGPVTKGNLGLHKKRSNLFYPDETTSTDPAWQIAKNQLLGKHTWDETVKKWKKEVCFAAKRTIQDWVAELEPRIVDTLTPDEALACLKRKHAKKRA